MYTNRETKEAGMSSVLGGVILGITAGALAVILSDKKNRHQLSKKAGAAKTRLQDSVSALKGKGEDLAANFKEDATNEIQDINDSIKTL
jgi:CHASE1-domain containing sensor protein